MLNEKRDAMKIIILGNLGYIGPAVTQQFRLSFPNAELIGFDIGYFFPLLESPSTPTRGTTRSAGVW
jgi:hypothetical protein